MNRIWRHLSTSVTAVALLSFSAPLVGWAAEGAAIKVRAGEHEGYTRLVFEGDTPPEYTSSKTDTSLTLKFSKPAQLEVQGPSPETLARVKGYKTLDSQSVEVDFQQGLSVRHFIIGNRLIVDLKGTDTVGASTETKKADIPPKDSNPQDLTAAISKKPPEKIIEKKEEVKPKDVKREANKKEESPLSKEAEAISKKLGNKTPQIRVDDYAGEQPPAESVSDEKAKVAGDVTQPSDPQPPANVPLAPYQVTVAGTTGFALAAFEKGRKLWIVIDKPDFLIPPQVEGPPDRKLAEFERVANKDVTIFKTEIPENYHLSGSGGGLLWTITMDDGSGERKHDPHPLYQDFKAEKSDKGPTLKFDAKSLHRNILLEDPETGEKIFVGLVNSAEDYSGEAQSFAELKTLSSPIGLSLISKVDDLTFAKNETGAEISRPKGLTLSPEKDISVYKKSEPKKQDDILADKKEISKIFDFKEWMNGGVTALADNQSLILSNLLEQTDARKTESLLSLGRMMLSNGYSPEANGYFEMASRYTPEMEKNPEFKALEGASKALSGSYKESFLSFSDSALDQIDEIKYWKAYSLAGLDDWQQAAKTLPDRVDFLKTYPNAVMWPVALKLCEVALREGNTGKADAILKLFDGDHGKKMPLGYSASLTYLKGEYLRQKGDIDKAKELWLGLTTGMDDLYRAKSRLAMATLQYARKEITIDKAIDTLEGLRYAWRGDELEASINFNLGKIYLEKGQPVRALGLMRQASSLIPNSEQGKMISQIMHATFNDLYMTDKIQELSPLEALTMFEEFSDLVPEGVEGDRMARQLAERLVQVDLLPRAITLLKKQVDTKLSGLEGASVAIRLASLEIQDSRPKSAIESLDKAEEFLQSLKAEEAAPKKRAIAMLRAKALSQLDKSQEAFSALSLLPQDEDALRLRADIAWKAKKWQDSADALELLISKQDISMTRPLENDQARLILNWALSLYLADNRYVLANLRERYSDLMSQSKLAKEFEVVTRPRQNVLLADRETIQTVINETDIFKNFLESFKEDLTGPLPAATAPPARNKEGKIVSPKLPIEVPEEIKAAPDLKTDEVLAD